jgi:hypothetical protein
MYIREFVPGTYVAELSFIFQASDFAKFLKSNVIRAVYIAPASYYESCKSYIHDVDVYPFGGGFMENSLVLFPLTTKSDIAYFEKITEIKYVSTPIKKAQEPEPCASYIAL